MRRLHDRWHCVVLRAYRNWDFPKGLVEAGEAPLAAALREVEEETGLTGLALPWGELWRETAPCAGGKVARYYLAESTAGEVVLPINPALGRGEPARLRRPGSSTRRRACSAGPAKQPGSLHNVSRVRSRPCTIG